jgi:hypothetical protein
MRNVTLLVCKRWHTAALNEQTLLKVVVEGYGYGVERHSQQFFIYIVVVSFCSWLRTFEYPDGGENHRPAVIRRQTLPHMLYRVHLIISRIRTHNFSGDKRYILEYRIN